MNDYKRIKIEASTAEEGGNQYTHATPMPKSDQHGQQFEEYTAFSATLMDFLYIVFTILYIWSSLK